MIKGCSFEESYLLKYACKHCKKKYDDGKIEVCLRYFFCKLEDFNVGISVREDMIIEKGKKVKDFKNVSYNGYVDALQLKYGIVPMNYYEQYWIDKNPENETYGLYKSKDWQNKAAVKGMYVHHVFENVVGNLNNKKVALINDYVFQKKENLCYCNAVEHLVLHLLIIKNYNRINASVVIPLLVSAARKENDSEELWNDIVNEFGEYCKYIGERKWIS